MGTFADPGKEVGSFSSKVLEGVYVCVCLSF